MFASDRMRSEFTDSFGNVLPQSGDVASFVASPDGRHVYMAGSFFYLEIDPQAGFIFGHRNQMLVFERVYGD
ncbi:MAG: hypothetical protein F4089_09660 [Gammaproteobacteria bacterium]|nr:hypothetical protein [Gammaproteobacteria bacterium]